ncbi:MAG: FAD-binding molybdopterin dehydrogenase [Candidatus Tectimicrobiota bacterium]|nr:MAG: FAD-binding molybdopterin dehydrogenase [Candidatus Tectomicrobia bacterium]
MRPFRFVEPTSLAEAVRCLQAEPGKARLLAGGSDLLAELKDELVAYDCLVSLAKVPELTRFEVTERGLYLGAMVTLAQLEHDPRLHGPYRLLAEAARGVAVPEIRAQGTLGGNLCQRPRCFYYRQALTPCLKKGGPDCPARESPYQQYLVLMGGAGCYSAHPSDLAPALIALDAEVDLVGPSGARSLPLERFFIGPEVDVQRETALAPDEILTAVRVPLLPSGWRGTYLKARERTAGDFAVVSVAAGYALECGTVVQPRLVLGGVAPVPWRSRQAEALLAGQAPTPEAARRCAEAALAAAQPLPHNAYKVDIARALIARTILALAG